MKKMMFGIAFDAITRKAAVNLIGSWLHDEAAICRFVVTPNIDHIVLLNERNDFRDAYVGASLTLADGWPVVTVSRWLGCSIPETVPGSDLVPDLFDSFSAMKDGRVKVFLLGAAPGVAEKAARRIAESWCGIEICGVYSPSFGFEHDASENERICQRIRESQADLLVIGLGAPKQELWISKYANRLPVKVALCVGATIDFLAGEKQRAPMWVRRMRLEWLHRLVSEPRRLGRRYLKDAIIFPLLTLREMYIKYLRL